MPGTAILEAHGLTKSYLSGEIPVRALKPTDVELRSGELVVLLGPSGSGKSTLLNVLGGLDTPSEGTLRFRDRDLSQADLDQLTRYRRDWVGFVFQFYNLIPSLTALENVELVTDIAKDPMSAEEALHLVGLSERLDHFLPSFRGASSSGWPSPAPLPSARPCSFVTNPRERWTTRRGSRSSR